jgi:hypothetical protein
MSWGCDTALYRTVEAMRTELRCGRGWPTVIKRNRGNGGQGVWKVEALESPRNRPMVRALDATKDAREELSLDEFLEDLLLDRSNGFGTTSYPTGSNALARKSRWTADDRMF